MNKKKRILVTGGGGFIGTNLCLRLLDQGHEVICLDNFSTGIRNNVSTFDNHPNFKLVMQDITEPISLEVDQIYNLACPASPVHYQRDPIKTLKTSLLGAINVLDLAVRTNAKVLQASTSEVYGDPAVHPQPETYWGHVNPIGPRSCYDESKRCAETLFLEYHNKYGIEIKIVRIFNTYGPFMNSCDGRVVCNFIVQALLGEDLTVYGDGSQTRSFCYIDDLIKGMDLMMNSDPALNGPVNLGNPAEFSMRELAEKVLLLTASKSKISFSQLPVDDPKHRCPDIQLAKTALGWEPKISLENGLKRTIAYFRGIVDTTQ